ncbi:L,D-transpeptidase [Nocardioides sp. HDW12B]|uniref:L,D-transpeptidase n=1 Tax=Nocardioides sp. HDW12B TaxID=2714939 RepID=UPI00140E2C05|nr:L,D-transpeptidase [Nocardioides sp. HDW12B]QIK67422.1 L,D-transpeptidase [Nocardioides sp. HDW12B]
MSAAVTVRRGRVLAAGTAALVTGTAVVGALIGVGGPASTGAYAAPPATGVTQSDDAPLAGAANDSAAQVAPQLDTSPESVQRDETPLAVPSDSGSGRRVVFDMSDQHVWLVRDNGRAARSYPVSGSVYDNLDPGTYEVYSRSEQAYAFDGSGSMRFMVRFTQGDNAAIGFHDIPIDTEGRKVQTRAELGTAQSHGCIRQWPDDAKALWRFAPVGTTVVVTA